MVTKKIARFSKCTNAQPSTIQEDDNIINYLHQFHKQFVMVPADKASNKMYYCVQKILHSNLN